MTWLSKSVSVPVSRSQYREQARTLRQALLEAQSALRTAGVPLVVLLAGVDGAGKGESVNLLNAWMDPRWIRTHAFDDPSDEESERPDFWRFWRALPPRGYMALFLSAWYSAPLLRRVEGSGESGLPEQLERVRRLERTLTDGGCGLVKFWLHLDKDAQERRFRELERDPLQSWRVTARDWHNWSLYDRFAAAAEEILEATHTEACPWIVIDGEDPHRRALEVGDGLLRSMRSQLGRDGAADARDAATADPEPPKAVRLPSEPPSQILKAAYTRELEQAQARLNRLHRRARERGITLIGVFEGRDAGGKGGAIRRVVPAFDARVVRVERIGPPTQEEREHHYLWRFWRRLPRAGRVLLFDRSWYGRVLVERVERLASEEEWSRAYEEINDFERQIAEHGVVLVKFWLEISKSEQKRRFEERQRVPHKRWKLTEEDLRNRNQWKAYDAAVHDMLERTDTPWAPWIVVPANDKRHTRIEVVQHVSRRLEECLDTFQSAGARAAREAAGR